jgi:hypothetical protein
MLNITPHHRQKFLYGGKNDTQYFCSRAELHNIYFQLLFYILFVQEEVKEQVSGVKDLGVVTRLCRRIRVKEEVTCSREKDAGSIGCPF